jgi:hypothetical protein
VVDKEGRSMDLDYQCANFKETELESYEEMKRKESDELIRGITGD